jgi:hypothetical protein
MKKFLGIMLVLVMAITTFTSCSIAKVDGDEEGVFIKQPWFFGSGGVQEKALIQGSEWKVFTTDFVTYKKIPVKYSEVFDDVFCDDNTPLDLSAHITLKIKDGKSPILHKNYGVDWYDNNVKENFREIVRNFISTYNMYTLVSNREVYDQVKIDITEKMQTYFNKLNTIAEFPVEIVNVVVDKAKPNDMVMEELNKTAAMTQQKITQQRQQEMEDERGITEEKRAKADGTYMKAMGLTADGFIKLRYAEIELQKVEMIKNKENVNIDVLLGNSTQMWDIKQK